MNAFVLAILVYLLYRFVAGFLVPLFRTSIRMRQQFHKMNGKSNTPGGDQANQQPGKGAQQEPPKSGSKVGEYIDFEDVK